MQNLESPRVERLTQVLLWPLRLLRQPGTEGSPWASLTQAPGSPWREVVDEFTGEPGAFHERHYQEFLTFLPYVQRVLFGESRAGVDDADPLGEPGIKTLRRHDIGFIEAQAQPHSRPLRLQVVHADLLFFHDIDIVMLNLELSSAGLSLTEAEELMYRLGRAYPGGWDAEGEPLHALHRCRLLAPDGSLLAENDTHDRQRFIGHVQAHRAPRVAAHWAWLLRPLLPDQGGETGAWHYRQIEYHRMPLMAHLALDAPERLSRADFVRLGLVTGAGSDLPYGEAYLQDFEQRYCWDRFWCAHGAAPFTRYLCSGHALVVVGRADSVFFSCRDRGVLAQFRHPQFLLFLVAHFQKAALLVFADRLVDALRRLNVAEPENVRVFKRQIRAAFEGFLRFTHRYWFHEVSEQAQSRALYGLLQRHLDTRQLYAEVKGRIEDMAAYLETDSIRRQANTVVRLTVVTTMGLVGTVTTGVLGMNLLAESESPLSVRLAWFGLTLVATLGLTVYTVMKSKRLSDFLDALSDERLGARERIGALLQVWK